jgi:hypothetical protein
MNLLKSPIHRVRLLAAGSAIFLCLGRGAMAAPSYEALMNYTPASSSVRFNTPVSVLVEHVITPEVQAVWLRSLNKAELENYRQAVCNVIFNDLSRSGIFPDCRNVTGAARGYLGITFDSVTPKAAMGKDSTGLVISSLTPNGPAIKAGLKVKDVIAAVNGKPVETAEALRSITAQTPPGTRVTVKYLRDAKAAELDVVLADAAEAIASGFLVRVRSEEILTTECQLKITLTVIDCATRQVISGRVSQLATGKRPVMAITKRGRSGVSMQSAISTLMSALRTAMIADLQAWVQKVMQQAVETEIASFQTAALTDLLVASDKVVATVRARNRAIIAAKTRQLPGLLRDMKTDGLTTLVVRIEQTILDLNHESEVAKDRAQQASAANGNSSQIDELRDLSISYRERIELLKPIAAALKEEIANRNR